MKKDITPINKGNYNMDSPEREALFEMHRGYGWEEDYHKYRENWVNCAKDKEVLDYPLLVDLELSTVCNLNCPMCYTITPQFKEKVFHGFMDFELYKKIIDEINGKVPAIRLSLRGESTLHPDFIKCIVYAKQAGIREVSSLTNGSNLTPDFFEKSLIAGLDWWSVSIDGMYDQYEKIRYPLKFEETLEKIKIAKKIKEKYQVNRPVVKIQSIWPAVRDDVEEYYHTFEPYVDLIAFNPLEDNLQVDSDIDYEEEFSCPQIYQRLLICADGKAIPCTCDTNTEISVGDANIETIHEIWHGKKLNDLRMMHKTPKGFLKNDVCRKCPLPRKVEANESGWIDGREFKILNYTKRTQVIGK